MTRVLRPWLILLFITCGLAESVHAEERLIPLKKGDRILFLGDSITQSGDDIDTGYVRLIRRRLAEKHADFGIEVLGAGISGNTVPDLQARLERDVLAKKPTIVVIYIGINDVWHRQRDQGGTSPEAFATGLNDVISRCTAAGARVVLCTPTMIGEKKNGANVLDRPLDQYADISRDLAQKHQLTLCDLRKTFVDYQQDNNRNDVEQGLLTSDQVHLNDAGNRLVAETVLKIFER